MVRRRLVAGRRNIDTLAAIVEDQQSAFSPFALARNRERGRSTLSTCYIACFLDSTPRRRR